MTIMIRSINYKLFFANLLLAFSLSLLFISNPAHAQQLYVIPAIPAGLPGYPIQVNNNTWKGFIKIESYIEPVTNLVKFTTTIYNENGTFFGKYPALNVTPSISYNPYPLYVDFDIVGLSSSVTHVRAERRSANLWRTAVRWNGVNYIRSYSN